MAKITAWLVTIVGILLLFVALGTIRLTDPLFLWVLALSVLIIGITKLIRNYNYPSAQRRKAKRRR